MRYPSSLDDSRNQIAQALLASSQSVELIEEKNIHAIVARRFSRTAMANTQK